MKATVKHTDRHGDLKPAQRSRINRRAFLVGTGGVTLGLPFLEGLPERSAWAQGENPIFTFFICAANGVVGKKFWPSATGELTASSMTSGDPATGLLSDYAANLLIVKGVSYPGNLSNCGHAQGLCQALTGTAHSGGGPTSQSGGISVDMVISKALNPAGVDPLTLYSGRKSYIGERLSFAGAGNARSAEVNPFNVYRGLTGLATTGGTSTPMQQATVDDVLVRRKSVNDFVRDELKYLLTRSDLSAADRGRLEAHSAAIREIELGMTAVAAEIEGCTATGLDEAGIAGFERLNFSQNGHMIEDIVKLHGELVAFAFACNANRTASLQWGDGTDATIYDVPSNSRKWSFHHVSHRIQSDGASGNDATAEAAHGEVDRLRMGTLKHILEHFSMRGLFQNSAVLWTNHVSDGPSHSFSNLPFIIAGNAGGYLKQGQYVDGTGTKNGTLLNTLVNAAGLESTAMGSGSGQLDAIRAG